MKGENIMSNVQNVIDFRQRRKRNLIKVLGSCCALCGYDYCIEALEFHHIKPEEKSYQLSSGNCHKLEEDLKEAKKCLLVCANCHREIHFSDKYNGINLFDYQKYNEEIANQLLTDLQPVERKCSNCGASITRYSSTGLCQECSHIESRAVERPSREELKKLIREKSFLEIGRIYKVSDNAIRKWCDSENLPRKKTEINKITDEE